MAAIDPPTSKKSLLVDLPFDQYSRQYIVGELINRALRVKKEKFKIIDLGGHKGKTADFLPVDDVTILDVFDEEYQGYIKGDATNMSFADDTFDIACSFDVFEHIPRSKRLEFIKEALRVSRIGVFIAMPVDETEGNGVVSRAESTLNTLHKTLYGNDHRWLKEHIDYRIPNEKEVHDLLTKVGVSFTSLPSNQITDWQLLQTMIFIAAKNPYVTETAQQMNRWYNTHIDALEKGITTGYRRIYFVSNDEVATKNIQKVVDVLLDSTHVDADRYLPIHQTVLEQMVQACGRMGKTFLGHTTQITELNSTIDGMKAGFEDMKAEIDKLQEHNMHLTQELYKVHTSTSWRLTKPLRFIRSLHIK